MSNMRLSTNQLPSIARNKVAIEVGGYKGLGIRKFSSLGFKEVHVFEPVEKFYNECKRTITEIENDDILFPHKPKIHLNQKALWVDEEDRECVIEEDGSSLFLLNGEEKESVKTTTLLKYMEENNIDDIDYLQINCEGAEYSLMRYILDNNLDERIVNIRVQYHQNLVTEQRIELPFYEPEEMQLGEFIERGWFQHSPEHAWSNIANSRKVSK